MNRGGTSMKRNPLAIDLFCGLFQPQVLLATDVTVEQLVACGTKNPKHVPLCVGSQAPCAVALKFGTVSNLHDARFAARLARRWHVRKFGQQAIKFGVFARPSRIVNFLNAGFAPMEEALALARRFHGTFFRAIPLVCIRQNDFEVGAARSAVSPVFCHVKLFEPSSPSGSLSVGIRTPFFVWPYRLKSRPATFAKQIIHSRYCHEK